MLIIKPSIKQRGSENKAKTHIVEEDLTLCNIRYKEVVTLGFPKEGSIIEVTCKKCLNKQLKV